MTTDIMQLKVDGTPIYVKTHANAVENLNQFVSDLVVQSGTGKVESVNGKTGSVVLKATDVGALPDTTSIPSYTVVTTSKDGLMSISDKKKLDSLPNLTLEKVGTV